MKANELIEEHKKIVLQMNEICRAKNQDYSGAEDDAFMNFKMVELIGITNAETGLLTRLTDKFMRVKNLLQAGGEGAVKDESVEDTCLDAANYFILLALYLRSKRKARTLPGNVTIEEVTQ